MKSITKRQQEVLDFIKSYVTDHHFPPTMREISDHFDISVKGAYDHVKALERKRFINLGSNRSRTIEVLDDDKEDELLAIPILGNVAAGKPLFAEENHEGDLRLPQTLLPKGKHFALRVRGDSMRDAGIMEGDLAVIRKQEAANNGEIVVAVVDEAVTLKRFYREKNRVKLQAENPAYPPIFTQDVRLLGKLVHLIRQYD